MQQSAPALIDPWRIEIIAVSRGSHGPTERKSLSRDTERGLLRRLAPGIYVERLAFDAMTPEAQHVVRMRALVAVAGAPVVFSHFSAAVLHGLPVLRARLEALHLVVGEDDERHRVGVVSHRFLLRDEEVVRFGPLTATDVGRTVVDVAGGAPFEEGVMAADGALAAGVPRAVVECAVDLAGPRRARTRIGETIAFAHPGAESAAESRWRTTSMRLGVEVPVLQHRVRLRDGSSAFLDGLLSSVQVGVEVDGDAKLLDPAMARNGTAAALLAEKRRQDEVLAGLRGLVRIGWVQSGSVSALRAVYSRARITPANPRARLVDYCM